MRAYIIDTETTGIDPCEVIELAVMPIEADLSPGGWVMCERFRPEGEITFGAMAAHHILPQELGDKRPTRMAKLPEDLEYMIGHNVDFDWKALGSPNVKRIDTLALARKLWPECDSHSQSALMYFLFGPRHDIRDKLRNAHSAEVDVEICSMILERICEALHVSDIETLYEESEEARIPTTMPFGKHKGQPISEVPKSYADWYRRQDNPDPFIIEAFRRNRK